MVLYSLRKNLFCVLFLNVVRSVYGQPGRPHYLSDNTERPTLLSHCLFCLDASTCQFCWGTLYCFVSVLQCFSPFILSDLYNTICETDHDKADTGWVQLVGSGQLFLLPLELARLDVSNPLRETICQQVDIIKTHFFLNNSHCQKPIKVHKTLFINNCLNSLMPYPPFFSYSGRDKAMPYNFEF